MSLITGIFGLQGSGKTMLCTYLGKRDYDKGIPLYSNYHLKGIDYTPITSLEDCQKVKNGTLLLDEAWLWIFSRSSMAKLNQELMKIVMLNRKRSVNIYYTAQLSRSIDVLLREVTNFFVYPVIRPYEKENKELGFRLCFYYTDLYKRMSKLYYLPNNLEYYGSFYDTHEEIDVLQKKKDSPLQKGIQLEETFIRALEKLKIFNFIEQVPNSGNNKGKGWSYDVVAYRYNSIFAFDVKGCNNNRVLLKTYGKALNKKIDNAYRHNAKPYLAFPKQNKKLLTNPKNWYVTYLHNQIYLLKLSSFPKYNKIVGVSMPMTELIEVVKNNNPLLRNNP